MQRREPLEVIGYGRPRRRSCPLVVAPVSKPGQALMQTGGELAFANLGKLHHGLPTEHFGPKQR